MVKKEENIIIDLLSSSGAAYRGQGIALCIKRKNVSPEIADILKSLKNDNICVLGRPLSSYAIAALDILNIERYQGDDADIQDLIKGLPVAFA